jgi:methionine salvage enolase-phosphatase E1
MMQFLFLCKIFSENLNKYFNLFFDTTISAKVKMIFAAAAA